MKEFHIRGSTNTNDKLIIYTNGHGTVLGILSALGYVDECDAILIHLYTTG